MLEIIGIIILARYIGKIIREKGRKPGWYQFMTVMFWLVFELIGAVIGTLLFGEGFASYGFGLLGAGIGALSSVFIAKSLPEAEPVNKDMLDSGIV